MPTGEVRICELKDIATDDRAIIWMKVMNASQFFSPQMSFPWCVRPAQWLCSLSVGNPASIQSCLSSA